MLGFHYLFFINIFVAVPIYGKVIGNQLFPLTIVHYNDFHARFEETAVNYAVCLTNDTRCLGGFARLYQEIKTLFQDYPDALLLNAGDVFQGTYWYTLLKWNVSQNFINMLPNDAHALGNHEFDDDVQGLAPYIAALKAPVLAANLDSTDAPELNGLYQNHTIVERNGRKIGIIGLITTETAILSNPGGVKFLNPVPIVQKEAQELKDKGVDIIIVLSHCGLDTDKYIAKTVGENIDIIVGGHTHSLLWNGISPSNETISGSYPVIVEAHDDSGHKVIIITASAFTKYLGNITVYFDERGDMQTFDGTPIFLNRSIPEDPEIKALLAPYTKKMHDVVQEVVGNIDGELLAGPCGSRECALGNLVTNSLLDATRQKNPSNLTSFSFVLRNNIRISMPKGEIQRGTVINILPFSNKVVSFDIKGRYMLAALERCLTHYWQVEPYSSPWLPMVSGLKVTINSTEPRSVTSVLVKEGDNYEPLDLDKMYQMTTFNFLIKGGGGFKMISQHATNLKEIGTDSQILEDYVKKVTPISSSSLLDNRLILVK